MQVLDRSHAPAVDQNSLQQLTSQLNLGGIPPDATTSKGSTPGSNEGYESAGSSETDITEPETAKEFEMTSEAIARVASLPDYKSRPSLPGLPTELQLEIFHHLDKIDSVCLGLSNPRSYRICRAIYGTKMPLNTRRESQNPLARSGAVTANFSCAHCGNSRCELHEHIKSWVPKHLEYCNFSQKFGSCAAAGAKDACYRGKPSKPNRCGRHPVRTTTIHQDDNKGLNVYQ